MAKVGQIDKGTQCVWSGEESYLMQGATQVPVVHSVSFGYEDVDEWLDVALGKKAGHIYGRNTNPTVHAFEEKVRQLEGAEAATSAATAAATNAPRPPGLLRPLQPVARAPFHRPQADAAFGTDLGAAQATIRRP